MAVALLVSEIFVVPILSWHSISNAILSCLTRPYNLSGIDNPTHRIHYNRQGKLALVVESPPFDVLLSSLSTAYVTKP